MTSGAPDAWDGMAAAADALAASSHAIALTGAGLSVESGIPSFRGPDGLWTRYGQPSNLSVPGVCGRSAGMVGAAIA